MTETPPAPPVLPVVFECEITEADYLAMRKHAVRELYPRLLPVIGIAFVLVLLLSWFVDLKSPTEQRAFSVVGMAVTFCLVMGVTYAFMQYWHLPRWNRAYLGPIGKQQFTVGTDSFRARTAWGTSEWLLVAIKTVDETPEHFFVIARGGSGYAIPKHTLGTFAPFHSLGDRVKALRSQS